MSLVDESLEFNSFLGGELVTVESESTTEIIQKINQEIYTVAAQGRH